MIPFAVARAVIPMPAYTRNEVVSTRGGRNWRHRATAARAVGEAGSELEPVGSPRERMAMTIAARRSLTLGCGRMWCGLRQAGAGATGGWPGREMSERRSALVGCRVLRRLNAGKRCDQQWSRVDRWSSTRRS